MPRVIHFDVQATDPDRAMAFYRDVFGWSFERWDGPMDYWMVSTGPAESTGIDGGLAPREGGAPDPEGARERVRLHRRRR